MLNLLLGAAAAVKIKQLITVMKIKIQQVDHVPAEIYLPLWLHCWRHKLCSSEYGHSAEYIWKCKGLVSI